MNELDDLRDRLFEIRRRIERLDNKMKQCCRWHDNGQLYKLSRQREQLRRVAEQYEQALYTESENFFEVRWNA